MFQTTTDGVQKRNPVGCFIRFVLLFCGRQLKRKKKKDPFVCGVGTPGDGSVWFLALVAQLLVPLAIPALSRSESGSWSLEFLTCCSRGADGRALRRWRRKMRKRGRKKTACWLALALFASPSENPRYPCLVVPRRFPGGSHFFLCFWHMLPLVSFTSDCESVFFSHDR